MAHNHAVIWIDHREARVFHFNPTEADTTVLHAHNPTEHLHHKANSLGSGHAAEDQDFLQRVALSVGDAGAILITGPANAKTELVKHIHKHNPNLIGHLAGIETLDHPSDGEIVAFARTYFKAGDRMTAQKP